MTREAEGARELRAQMDFKSISKALAHVVHGGNEAVKALDALQEQLSLLDSCIVLSEEEAEQVREALRFAHDNWGGDLWRMNSADALALLERKA